MKKGYIKKFLAGVVFFILISVCIFPSSGKILEKKSLGNRDVHKFYVGGNGPGNYTKIQDAINTSNEGDIVYVFNGTYNENIVIDRSIRLIGEDKYNTIISGGGKSDVIVISETSHGSAIIGFSIMFCGINKWNDAGIEIRSSFNDIRDNIISYNNCGIYLTQQEQGVEYNAIAQNNINNNSWFGLRIEDSNYNLVFSNYISDNNYGIFIEPESLPCSKDILPTGRFEDEIYDNTIIDNEVGIEISHSWGMNFSYNEIRNNVLGIRIFGTYGWGGFNRIHHNNIVDNVNGIIIDCFQGGATNNIITNNNFISNMQSAYFCSDNNRWEGNYWGRPRILPKSIRGRYRVDTPITAFTLPWLNFDWNPASEPYTI